MTGKQSVDLPLGSSFRVEDIIAGCLPLMRATLPPRIGIQAWFEGEMPALQVDVLELQQLIMTLCTTGPGGFPTQTRILQVATHASAVDTKLTQHAAAARGSVSILIRFWEAEALNDPGVVALLGGKSSPKESEHPMGAGIRDCGMDRSGCLERWGGTLWYRSRPGVGQEWEVRLKVG